MKRICMSTVFLWIAVAWLWPTASFAQSNGTPPTVLVDEGAGYIDVEDSKVWWWFVSPCAPTASTSAASAAMLQVFMNI